MKIKLILSLLFIILLTGCKDEYITCKIYSNNTKENYTLNSIYKIYYKDNYVINIIKEDKYSSTDKEVLDYYYEYKNLEYQHLKDVYGGYEYNIDYKDELLKINASIVLEEVNIKNMILDDILDNNYVIGDKLTKTGARLYYESKGATCDI